jgi:undecaprenyl-diphosphatase
MNLLHAALLGLIQGTTEVLPISSSAHLILLPRLLGWPPSGLTFDVALHFGTLLALLAYFRRDLLPLVRDGLTGFFQDDPSKTARLPWLLAAGTLPAVAVALLFESQIELIFRDNPLLIVLLLILFGVGLGLADRYGRQHHGVHNVTLRMALIIGSFQALALLPGVSRSGITITAALLVGLSRFEAARFSFLLSLPIVFGAALKEGLELLKTGIEPGMFVPMLVGITVAAVSGYVSVAFLLHFVQSRTVWPFVWYRLAAGGLLLIGLGAGWLT